MLTGKSANRGIWIDATAENRECENEMSPETDKKLGMVFDALVALIAAITEKVKKGDRE